MRRRQVLASIATSSVAGVGVVAADRRVPSAHLSTADPDELRVVRDGGVVETVTDPSTDEIRQLLSETDDDERLVSASGCCFEYCASDCDPRYSCDCCYWDCSCSLDCPDCC
ncbi:hypothetical protein BRC81_13160 [Halobacteriales archaeon QS_1_68_20]|nr:MAG: hypothetical protein BRC81_13160 [Halobacteriales archaeon QS_1_68_20]